MEAADPTAFRARRQVQPVSLRLASRCRTRGLSQCRQALAGAPTPPVDPPVAAPPRTSWPCPRCGAPMRIVERLTARQLFLHAGEGFWVSCFLTSSPYNNTRTNPTTLALTSWSLHSPNHTTAVKITRPCG